MNKSAVLLIVYSTIFSFFTSAQSVDYSLVCVDSVWYEPGTTGIINVRIYNGDSLHMNYPSVQIVNPSGDTISNVNNLVNFFAHLSNRYQTYSDTITINGISDFSGYSFIMNESFGSSKSVIQLCATSGIIDAKANVLMYFPNPATDYITLQNLPNGQNDISIFDSSGRLVFQKSINEKSSSVDLSGISQGVYLLRMINRNSTMSGTIIVR